MRPTPAEGSQINSIVAFVVDQMKYNWKPCCSSPKGDEGDKGDSGGEES